MFSGNNFLVSAKLFFRLMVVGLVNVCLAITPLPERIYLAYVLWSIIGSGTVMVVHYFSNPTVFGDLRFVIIFFIGLSFGGLVGIILSFFKYRHTLKRGTAYLSI